MASNDDANKNKKLIVKINIGSEHPNYIVLSYLDTILSKNVRLCNAKIWQALSIFWQPFALLDSEHNQTNNSAIMSSYAIVNILHRINYGSDILHSKIDLPKDQLLSSVSKRDFQFSLNAFNGINNSKYILYNYFSFTEDYNVCAEDKILSAIFGILGFEALTFIEDPSLLMPIEKYTNSIVNTLKNHLRLLLAVFPETGTISEHILSNHGDRGRESDRQELNGEIEKSSDLTVSLENGSDFRIDSGFDNIDLKIL
jgi:hypothetical protein